MNCSHCSKENTKKNGHTHYGKQNYFCHNCQRQFVEGGQEWFVNDSDKSMINKLLLGGGPPQRISLSGICRVCDVSQPWLLSYIKELYGNLPDDLNADLSLPDIESYLANRMDEEIGGPPLRENRGDKKNSISLQEYTQINDNDVVIEDPRDDHYLSDIEMNDLLVDELYSKERGVRVEYYGIQLDEMWTFVGNKENKQWLWLALNPINRQIIAFHIGGRSAKDAQLFYEKIPALFKGNTGFFSDYWQAYVKVFENEHHFGVGKESGLTAYIERFNGTLRQRVSRLVRKALSFSKSLDNHIGVIKYFICNYNLEMKALHL